MSVLDQSYRRWQGQPTSYFRRMLVIPHYDAMEILTRKAWIGAYVLALLPPIALGLVVYVTANSSALAALIPALKNVRLPLPGPATWGNVTGFQIWLLVAFGLLVGPPLATRDFANDALPLYLSKALRRSEYVVGRWAILLVLMSAASWIPLLIVFGLEMALAPSEWRSANAWMAGGILAATIPCILLLAALISAVAAHVKRSNLARVALLALLVVTWPVGGVVAAWTDTPAARVISPMAMTFRINHWAFEPPAAARPALDPTEIYASQRRDREASALLAFAVLAAWFGGAVAVLARRVGPVEVVK